MIVKEELDGIDIDDIENLVTNRRSQTFYKPIDVHSLINAIGESISSIRMWNIVNK